MKLFQIKLKLICLGVSTLLISNAYAQNVIDANFDDNVNHQADIVRTAKHDAIIEAYSDGVMAFKKIDVPNHIDQVMIPMYLFEPLVQHRVDAHPALVWVYGGIHDYFGVNYLPFIKEAVEQGYVVLVPEYRGAAGYGEDYYKRLDYGGLEVDDIITAGLYLKNQLPYVDAERMGVIGWSHGGYIALLSVLREQTLFAAAVVTVPVSNLIFRLSYKGPEYQQLFVDQPTIGSLPHANRQLYLQRSPSHLVEHLNIPLMAQFAMNDTDVEFVEAELLINALKAKKPQLAELVVYDSPENEHYLNRQVNIETLTREDDEVQIDSWNRIWGFWDKHLIKK